MLVADNVDRIITGYDVIIDGTDTFETRYLLNDAAVAKGIPVIHASVFRFEGQLTTFIPYEGPCYRCLYPTPPPPELAPGCSVAGVLGVVPGIMGMLQANEALKVLLGIGDTLAGRLLLFDALDSSFTELKLRRDPACPVCSTEAIAARAEGRPLPIPSFAAGAADRTRRSSSEARREHRPDSPGPARRRPAATSSSSWPAPRSVTSSRRSSTEYPTLRGQLLTDDGELNRFVNVYVNGQDVRYLDGLATPVGERDEVRLLPAMAGGLIVGALRARRPIDDAAPTSSTTRHAQRTPRGSPRTAVDTTTSSTRSGTRRSSRSRGCRRTRTSGSSPSSSS